MGDDGTGTTKGRASARWGTGDIPDQTGRTVAGHRGQLRARPARPPRRSPGPAPGCSWPAATPRRRPGPSSGGRPRPPTGPGPSPRWSSLDLADLASVQACAGVVVRARRAPRRAGQQRRRDGAAAATHRRRLRDAVRHQPPGPLRPHRPPAPDAPAGRRAPGGQRLLERPQVRQDPLGRPQLGAGPVLQVAGLRPDQAGQPPVQQRAPAAGHRGRHQARGGVGAPRLRRHRPLVGRSGDVGQQGDGSGDVAVRAGGRPAGCDGRPPAALRRHDARRRPRRVLRARTAPGEFHGHPTRVGRSDGGVRTSPTAHAAVEALRAA